MANQAEKNLLGAEDLIGYLLKEPKILQKVLSSLKPQARNYTEVKIIPEQERIYFGKYSWGGFSGFWQNLIKCFDHISYDDFYIKVWDALLEMSTNPVVNEAIQEGLSREVLIQGIHNKDQNILHRFFDVCRHLTDDGYWRDKGLKSNSAPHHHSNSCPFSGDVEIEVEPRTQRHRTVRVVDAVGDVFEVINVRWKGGRS
jgi:hypothetical protein